MFSTTGYPHRHTTEPNGLRYASSPGLHIVCALRLHRSDAANGSLVPTPPSAAGLTAE